MRNVYVIEALRTPFGSFSGCLADVPPAKLAAPVISAIMERTKLNGEVIDGIILGQVLTGGVGQAPARQAMRFAGIPDSVPALTINKVCGSGLMSLMMGATTIRAGEAELLLVGGAENMSAAPYFMKTARNGFRMGNAEVTDLMVHDGLTDPYSGKHMGEIAEAAVERNGLTRAEQDAYAIESYKRAQAALKNGTFKDELVPVSKPTRGGQVEILEDEEPTKVDFDKLMKLRTVFKKDGTITAGNASSINDGAGIGLIASEEAVKKYNLQPRARVVAQATASMHPEWFVDAPVEAIKRACRNANLDPKDIDLWEINEAFAAVPLVAQKLLGLDPAKVNVNGGAVAIGHPIGASGARLTATLISELHRRKARYGLATLCIGGGEAVAVIFERV